MNIKEWYKKRGLRFILERARRLRERYGFGPQKSINRIESCVETLRSYGYFPTFAVPGLVVERNPLFIKRLQAAGIEIAVHGYNHVDLQAYPVKEAARQLGYAVDVFRANGLEVHGFRCPYLSGSDDLLKSIPHGLFSYSSNKAIQWSFENRPSEQPENNLFETIQSFYKPIGSEFVLCLPEFRDGLVEIPACVPDDLQLHDGYGFGLEQISEVWLQILHQTYQRGEVFDLLFHPELASFCRSPLITVLKEAQSLHPKVWLAQLRDISSWWKEKSNFQVKIEFTEGHSIFTFDCTPRATILLRGLDPIVASSHWDQNYWRLESDILRINSPIMPLIGLSPDSPQWVVATLSDMGYILDNNVTANQCSLYIDETCLRKYRNPVDLTTFIENTSVPLIRFWPWPDGTRSALCITGDLDALTLFDYANRLFIK